MYFQPKKIIKGSVEGSMSALESRFVDDTEERHIN